MGIDVQRDQDTTVPQPLLNHLGASTLFQKQSSMSMSQVMGLDLAYARLFCRCLRMHETPCDSGVFGK